MRLDVAFTPALLREPERKVIVVIDVLRATSSLAAMFARGLDEALVAGTVAAARRLASAREGWLLCGEEGGLPPEGFDYGNSPAEFAALDLAGRRAVVATTNGTGALACAAASPAVITGAFVNLTAAAQAALHEAEARGLDMTLLCAGNGGGRLFSLDDAVCAGALVEAIERELQVEPSDSARAARLLYESYGNVADALADAEHARSLVAIGLETDVSFCAQRDRFGVAPVLSMGEDGTLRLTAC